MLEFLGASASRRKFRLFALACCRKVWTLITDPGAKQLVELAEQVVDDPEGADLLAGLRGERTPETTGSDNLRTVRLVFQAYASARTGEVIGAQPEEIKDKVWTVPAGRARSFSHPAIALRSVPPPATGELRGPRVNLGVSIGSPALRLSIACNART
jgi:hypothetical protein